VLAKGVGVVLHPRRRMDVNERVGASRWASRGGVRMGSKVHNGDCKSSRY
jgi:hypothetical protein